MTALFLWALQSTDGNGEEPSPQAPSTGSGHSSPRGRGSGGEDDEEQEDEEDGEAASSVGKGKKKGFSLIFDVVRRFAQPLGIHLPDWEHRIIETDKGIVRLLPVAERAKQLFGEDGAESVADQIERNPKVAPQLSLFPDTPAERTRSIRGRGRSSRKTVPSGEALRTRREAQTLKI